jgi:4-diphosphocytidyl-2-C-methyl-D-erythritol kinase
MLTLISPAKINLFLRILYRRPDSYHELASLFQAISLCDTLHFKLASVDALTCTDPLLPTDHSNLVIKAAQLFKRKTGITQGLSIHLEKNIPQQAGLGGGSSNAATTLWAFNELCGKLVSEEKLAEWAGEIGSDISFFLSQGTAYCTGRGEKITSLPELPKESLWIVKPPEGLSTPLVYGKLNASLLPQRNPEQALESFHSGRPDYFNDLEMPAFAVLPKLADLKRELMDAGFSTVLMSGSGSSFFCLGSGLPPKIPGIKCFKACFVNRQKGSWYFNCVPV